MMFSVLICGHGRAADCQACVLAFLTAADIARCARVNRAVRAACDDDLLWRPMLAADFRPLHASRARAPGSWPPVRAMDLYRARWAARLARRAREA